MAGPGGITVDNTVGYAIVPTQETTGFHPTWPVAIVNTTPYVKANAVSTANLVSIVGNEWTFSSAVGFQVGYATVGWLFERQGSFMAMKYSTNGPVNFVGYGPGDYIIVWSQVPDTVSSVNCGQFVIVAIDNTNGVVWFENARGVEELATASIHLLTADSAMPGDTLYVGTDAWGTANHRTFTVQQLNYVTPTKLLTVETPAASGAVAGPQPSVQLRNYGNHRIVKTIDSITPMSADPTFSYVKFTDKYAMSVVSQNYGSQLQALNKLGFPVSTGIGADGYRYSVGLVGEADRVMYGSETDPVSYPGVVAAGSNVNISGPIVKRIQVGLNLRVVGSQSTVFDAVRGAVATFINNSPVGESIAISDIVAVASAIGGVLAVSVSTPTYTTANDLITLQPYEKALVVHPDVDITITLAG